MEETFGIDSLLLGMYIRKLRNDLGYKTNEMFCKLIEEKTGFKITRGCMDRITSGQQRMRIDEFMAIYQTFRICDMCGKFDAVIKASMNFKEA